MSAKGRGPDSMLVHMSPREVASLQALAVKNGTSLTINPDTGLPEALKLKDILPAIAGVALGPAGFGLMSAGMAGLTVGGITTLATGSLSRGLMAGMGAYGASGLAEGLMGAGAGAAQGAAMSELTQEQIAQQMAEKGLSQQGVLNQAAADATSKYASSGFGDRLTQGASAAMNNPKGFVEGMGGYGKLAQSGLAAISPIMADQGVQTATQRPSTPANIRRYSFDPYGGKYTSQGLYPAEKDQGMAQGGIVALAGGGFTDAQVASYIQNNNLSGQALKDAGDVFGLNADQLGRAQALLTTKDPSIQAATDAYNASVAGRPDLVAQNLGYYNPAAQSGSGWEDVVTNRYIQDQPNAGYAQINAARQGSGITNEDLDRSFDRYGYSDALYNVTTSPDWKNEQGLTGFAGLSSNINAYVNKANEVNMTPAEKRARAYDDMLNSGMNMKDVVRATGKTIDELFPDRKPVVPIATATDLPGGVSGGGNTYVNPNGTVTTAPDIPGRPEGGFTGMGQVRDAYTQGGGSLGYVNAAPKTIDEFNQRFNKQSGSSLAAYEYLMGKGAYPTNSSTTEIMKPYSESALGIAPAEGRPTQKYIYDNNSKTYRTNPAFIPVTYDSEGKRVVGVSDNQVLDALTKKASGGVVGYAFGGTAQESVDEAQQKLNDFLIKNNVSHERIAAVLGISVPEAKKRYPLTSPTKAATFDTNQIYGVDGGGGGAGGFGAPGGVTSGVADSNSMTGGAFAAAMDALGLSQDPSSVGVVSMGETGFAADAAAAAAAADNGQAAEGGNTAAGVAAGAADAAGSGAGTGDSGGGIGAGDGGGGIGAGEGLARGGLGGLGALARGGATSQYNLGGYSDGGRLLRGPGDGVSDSIPATIGNRQPARLADGEFVVPARIVSELGNGSTEAGARKLYAMMDRVQKARGKTTGKGRVAANTRSDKHLPA